MIANGTTTLFKIGGQWLGFTHNIIRRGGEPYMERWIFWLLGRSVRIHKFIASDGFPVHDHPFWFITIPMRTYEEYVMVGWIDPEIGPLGLGLELQDYSWAISPPPPGYHQILMLRKVRAWRPHFRPAHYSHSVSRGAGPLWTICITGRVRRPQWGFWKDGRDWVPFTELGVRYDHKSDRYSTAEDTQ